MKLSIMMPAYNAAKYVESALQSLLRQRDAANMEIIVVNDGSTDGTGEIVREMASQCAEITLVETENGGVTRARNVALQHIAPDSELVSFLDSDDLSPAGRFQRDIRILRDDPSLELIYATLRLFEEMDEETLAPKIGTRTVDVRGVSMSAGLYKTSFVHSIGTFDEDFVQAEDTDFLLRVLESQPKMRVSDDIGTYYRRHSTSLTQDKPVAVREFSRALLKSAKRRKALGRNFELPQNVFDVKAMGRNQGWL